MKKLLLYLIFLFIGCSGSYKNEIPTKELNYPEELNVIKRNEWGWKPLLEKKNEAEIRKITIHHGGVVFTKDKDPKEELRNLQQWSREQKDWIDIPYHFMIDLD